MGLHADCWYGECMSTVEVARKSSKSSRPSTDVRGITILGATGSIGASTLDLIKREPGRYRVESISARRNAAALGKIAREVGARHAVVADHAAYRELKDALSGSRIEAAAGEEALVEAAQRPADWVMAAISGSVGLKPTLAAVERGATVALANKECLVCAGGLFMRRAATTGATVLPVDSEHNAVFQALGAGNRADVKRAILTASGGPFRTCSKEAIKAATPQQALRHPNWVMGPKVTIDSATLMNKGLEIIEAHHLFSLKSEEIDVLVHPQSVVHGLVEFRDGSVVAQLGSPDMRIPIVWPGRDGSTGRPRDWTLPSWGSSRLRRRISTGFPRLRLPGAQWKRVGLRPLCSMRPMRSPLANSSPAGYRFRRSRHWWKRPLMRPRDEVYWGNPPESTRRWPLTVLQEVWHATSCPKLP